uniref:F-box associated domain-containing protein n=1 Tax=Aegilops tauschii TaxID=37682 RepID=N1R1B7_AEGTA
MDYETEIWTFKCRVELPIVEIRLPCGKLGSPCNAMVFSCVGDELVLVEYGKWLLHVDMDGKLVASFNCKGLVLLNIASNKLLFLIASSQH